MAVEIKDEMTVEVFISIFLTENYFFSFHARFNFLYYIIDFRTRKRSW